MDVETYQFTSLGNNLVEREECSALLKGYILTGCDEISRTGTKASAVASVVDFGIEPQRDSSFVCAESPKSNCETFDDLRCEIYKMKESSE